MSKTDSTAVPVANATLVSTPASGTNIKSLDHWLNDFQEYDAVLAEMARASADNKFKDELVTIEQWFKVLSESERTASVYTLLQHSTQKQIRFFMALLQQMIKPEESTGNTDPTKPKNSKIGLRPSSLNIPLPGSSAPPTPIITSKLQDSVILLPPSDSNRLSLPKPLSSRTPTSPLAFQDGHLRTPALDKSWASMVNTPLVPMFQKPDPSRSDVQGSATNFSGIVQAGNVGNKGPGLAAINPTTLNVLATSGLSNDAQLLAVQLVMSGILQPVDITVTTAKQDQTPLPRPTGKSHKKGNHGNWRTTSNIKNPGGSTLKGATPKTSGLKSNGSKTSAQKNDGLDSASMEVPKIDDFNPDLLKDIPAWLRSLRLHKYTPCFEGLTWQEMVIQDDAMLEMKGVAAMGARRRLLRTFDRVQREMGMDSINTTAPTGANCSSSDSGPAQIVPQSATPITKLSADSPVFMPIGNVSTSVAPVVAPGPIITSAA